MAACPARALCQPVRPSVGDRHNTEASCPRQRYLDGSWVSARAARAPSVFVAFCPVWRAKPPWSTWRTQAEWNGNGCWLSALESLSLLKSWIFKDSIFVLLSLSSWSLLLDMITNYLLMTAGFQKYCCGTRCDKCLVGKLWSHLRFPIDEPWLAWCLSLISRDGCLSVSVPP